MKETTKNNLKKECNINIKIGDLDLNIPVKLKNPANNAESVYVFKVTNYNAHTERVYIKPINHDKELMPFSGEELVSITDIMNV